MARGVVAAFRELDSVIDAIESLKKRRFMNVTVYTPTPRHEIEHAIKPPVSKVRVFTLIGGLAGVTFGFWVAAWTSDYWPLIVGGKPVVSWIPFTIIGFELMVLIGSLATVAGMFINSRIPKIIATVGFDPRFTGADFGIYVEDAPERLPEAASALREAGAVEVRDER